MNGYHYNYSYIYGYSNSTTNYQLHEKWYYNSIDCVGDYYELLLNWDYSNTCVDNGDSSADITYITLETQPYNVYTSGVIEYYYLSNTDCVYDDITAFMWYNNICDSGIIYTCDSKGITITSYDTNECTGNTLVVTQDFSTCSGPTDDTYSYNYNYYLPFEDAYTVNIITTSCILDTNTNTNNNSNMNQITVIYGIMIIAIIIIGFAIAYVIVKKYLVPNKFTSKCSKLFQKKETKLPTEEFEMEMTDHESIVHNTTSKNPMLTVPTNTSNNMQMEEKEKLYSKVSIEI